MFGLCSLKLFLKTVYENIENTKKVFYENRGYGNSKNKKKWGPFFTKQVFSVFLFYFSKQKTVLENSNQTTPMVKTFA